MFPQVAAIINFCTNDSRFLSACIEGVRPFASQILIPVADHFYDGTPENRSLLEHAYGQHPDCEFIEFAYLPDQPYGFPCNKRPDDLDWQRHWHSTTRMIGYFFLRPEIEYVFFIDVDEIYEGHRVKQWLHKSDIRNYNALRLLAYQYFRQPCYQAETWFQNGLLVNRKALTPECILNIDERVGIYRALPEPKNCSLTGLDGLPLIHHYSWVRTKEEMLKKVVWGHWWERDWKSLIEEEFSAPFKGKDFNGHSYREVPIHFDPFSAPTFPASVGQPAHRVGPSEILNLYFFHKCSC